MKLLVIGSSSAGNCYILEDNHGQRLILEAGLTGFEIKKALGFNLQNIAGCLVSHEHGDHAKGVRELLKMGINIYTSRGTIMALGLKADQSFLHFIKDGLMYSLGNYKVIPFKVKHDVAEPLGFIINHPESGNILFITDSFYVKNTFKNIHQVIIEANFSEAIVKDKMLNGYLPDFRINRLFESHMSLEVCKKTLAANDLSRVQNIVLIHLSDSNSNADQFRTEIENQTGKRVYIADAGLLIENFNKTPF